MITIFFIVAVAVFMFLAQNSEKYYFLSVIGSLILLFGYIGYGIYKGDFHPLNNLKTEIIRKNTNDYKKKEFRLEFPTILKTEFIKKNKEGSVLTKFQIYNGKTISIYNKNLNEFKSKSIFAYGWISKNSNLKNTLLKNKKRNLIYSATYMKLKEDKGNFYLVKINELNASNKMYLPYTISYKLMNSFSSQKTSGIVAVVVEIIFLVILVFLISIGTHFITFE